MEIKITRNNEDIELKCENNEIESYNFTNTIDFSKLMTFLIDQELNEKITLINEIDNLNEQEKILCNLIKSIVNKYNSKVDELEEFRKNNDNPNKISE